MNKVLPPRQVPILTEVVQFEDPNSVQAADAAPSAQAVVEHASAEHALPAASVAASVAPAPTAAIAEGPSVVAATGPAPQAAAPAPQAAAQPAELPPVPPPAFLLAGSQEQIAHRVLTDLQRQIDSMLEYRLRETLTPALARMSDQLIRETRIELADTLRDVIARAVAQELARTRDR